MWTGTDHNGEGETGTMTNTKAETEAAAHAARWAEVVAEIAVSFSLANETALAARAVNATSDVLMAAHEARDRAGRARRAGLADCFAAQRALRRA